jgi:hypothetical protein
VLACHKNDIFTVFTAAIRVFTVNICHDSYFFIAMGTIAGCVCRW